MTSKQRTNTARFNAQLRADARYIGYRTTSGAYVVVQTAEGTTNLRPRLDLIRHSPVGFDWGRSGSGQAQLSLAILAHASGDDAFALEHHQLFQHEIIARFPKHRFEITGSQIHQIYGMCRRLGISAKARKESLSMYGLARLLHKRPQIVRRWIESEALQAENEGTVNVPRHMVSQDSLRRFCKDHPELIAGDRISQERLKFIFEYVFPRPHNDLLPVRESKKERAAYANQMSAEEREDEFTLRSDADYEESPEGL